MNETISQIVTKQINSTALIYVTNEDGKLQYTNSHLQNILGYEEQELNQADWSVLMSKIHIDQFWDSVRKYLADDNFWKGNICYKTKKERQVWFKVKINSQIIDDCKYYVIVGFLLEDYMKQRAKKDLLLLQLQQQ